MRVEKKLDFEGRGDGHNLGKWREETVIRISYIH